MSRVPWRLLLLAALAAAVVLTYVICAPAMLPRDDLDKDSSPKDGLSAKPPPAAHTKPSGIAYFLPIAEFTDSKWIRMNTILNKAVRVCDTATLQSVGRKRAADMRCNITVKSEKGWDNLCVKTRAMIQHLCETDGLGNHEFFVKLDDDTMVDPRMEEYIMRELSGRDVYFGFSPGFIEKHLRYHNWFPGPFYGVSANVFKQMCACNMPPCTEKLPWEDQWFGYMLGECNITREDILFDKGSIFHREYTAPRVSVKFHQYTD
ncbi:hypothetical protein IWQ56_000278 [Coemansia nantahalensis]|nr:hypothetical protein IWQ56_000278 [Coemansia nantahalensis]